jgi:hypothetical protein
MITGPVSAHKERVSRCGVGGFAILDLRFLILDWQRAGSSRARGLGFLDFGLGENHDDTTGESEPRISRMKRRTPRLSSSIREIRVIRGCNPPPRRVRCAVVVSFIAPLCVIGIWPQRSFVATTYVAKSRFWRHNSPVRGAGLAHRVGVLDVAFARPSDRFVAGR